MMRPILLCLVVLMWACGRPERDLKEILPMNVDGGWKREDVEPLHPSDLPSDVTGMPWKGAVIAHYVRGDGNAVNVRLIEFKSEAVAFELMQRWRQSEGFAFYKGTYFVVCRPDGIDAQQLGQFTRALQNNMARQS
ncbi:MAG TPA: hypothetical protein VFL57_09125 [Bryobacteraceae bacterium]|nr:hypothetical protein [Bryobacteraceae bacterium]